MIKRTVFKFITPVVLIVLVSPVLRAQLRCEDLLNSAVAPTVTVAIELEKGRQIFVEIIAPAKPSRPTLLLMPGIIRGTKADETAVLELARQGFGVVTFNFSTQPRSVGTLAKDVQPAFLNSKDKGTSLSNLATEVELLVQRLKAQGIKNIVPVSLSFSGAVSPYLTGFDLIIDTVPLTSMAENRPDLEKYRRGLNLFSPWSARAVVDETYRTQWRTVVPGLITEFKLPPEGFHNMVEGYRQMSTAVEGFAWENLPSRPEGRHVFIVAGTEAPSLLKHQLKTFRKILETQKNALMYIILDAGHMIWDDQPQEYARILGEVLSDKKQNKSGIVMINVGAKTNQYFTAEQAPAFIDNVLAEMR